MSYSSLLILTLPLSIVIHLLMASPLLSLASSLLAPSLAILLHPTVILSSTFLITEKKVFLPKVNSSPYITVPIATHAEPCCMEHPLSLLAVQFII